MKITSLDGLRKDVKQKYSDALKSYVTQYFGRPLEKLTIFFDGIQQRLATGIKESESGYQVRGGGQKKNLSTMVSAMCWSSLIRVVVINQAERNLQLTRLQ